MREENVGLMEFDKGGEGRGYRNERGKGRKSRRKEDIGGKEKMYDGWSFI